MLEKWQLLVQLRSPRLEKHVALQLWTRYSVSSMEVMVIRWKRRLPWPCQFKWVIPRPGSKSLWFLAQTKASLQPKDQVVDKRAEPNEEMAAHSSVRCRTDHFDEFTVPLDDPNEEVTEQWQDGVHDCYTCSVKSARISSGVSQRRSSSNIWSFLRRRSVAVRTNSQVRAPSECDPHSASRDPVLSCLHRSHQLLHGSNAVSVYLTCLECRHHAKWTQRTKPTFQKFSRAPTTGTIVVGKISTTGKMMCLLVLMEGVTSCLDRVVRAILVVDALPTNSPCVDIFHADPSHSRGSVERRVRKNVS